VTNRITAHLHELVFAMDGFSNRVLSSRFDADYGLFVFLNPLLDGSLDVTRLAERLNLTKAAVSKRVPVLERDGWLETSADPGHGRRVVVTLTARGRTLVTEAGTLLASRFAEVLSGLTIDAERFDADLVAMISAVRTLSAEERS
jgi:DNA-binding MarR family transcriptional regulator